MTHIRTQIRHRFRDALDASLPPEYVVAASRKRKRNDTTAAFVSVVTPDDQQGPLEVMGDARIRTASVYVRVQRSGVGDTLDDALDADEIAVAAAVQGLDWSDLLEEPPENVRVSTSFSGDAGREVSELVVQFDCEYRHDRTDLETPIR